MAMCNKRETEAKISPPPFFIPYFSKFYRENLLQSFWCFDLFSQSCEVVRRK